VSFFAARSFPDAGTFYSVGARGCYDSHLSVLKEAAHDKENVLIIEDDCDFEVRAKSYNLPQDWQIFYGGYGPVSLIDPEKSDYIVGSHLMGFRSDILPILVSYLDRLLEADDHPGIDGAYMWFRREHPEVKVHFAVPSVGNQRQSRTDVGERKFFDRTPGLIQAASMARRLKRWVKQHVSDSSIPD
jgi:glycosyl transferase family 25